MLMFLGRGMRGLFLSSKWLFESAQVGTVRCDDQSLVSVYRCFVFHKTFLQVLVRCFILQVIRSLEGCKN